MNERLHGRRKAGVGGGLRQRVVFQRSGSPTTSYRRRALPGHSWTPRGPAREWRRDRARSARALRRARPESTPGRPPSAAAAVRSAAVAASVSGPLRRSRLRPEPQSLKCLDPFEQADTTSAPASRHAVTRRDVEVGRLIQISPIQDSVHCSTRNVLWRFRSSTYHAHPPSRREIARNPRSSAIANIGATNANAAPQYPCSARATQKRFGDVLEGSRRSGLVGVAHAGHMGDGTPLEPATPRQVQPASIGLPLRRLRASSRPRGLRGRRRRRRRSSDRSSRRRTARTARSASACP